MEEYNDKSLSDDMQYMDEEPLFRYAIGETDAGEERDIKAHLKKCEICSLKVQEFVLIHSRLTATPDVEVPEALVRRVAEGWEKPSKEVSDFEDENSFHLVLQFAADCLEIMKESFLPNTEIEWKPILEPTYMLRGSDKKGGHRELQTKHYIMDENISMNINIREDEKQSVQIEIRLTKPSVSLTGVPITLKRKNGIIIHSKTTDPEGGVIFERVLHEDYIIQIALPSKKIKGGVEIR